VAGNPGAKNRLITIQERTTVNTDGDANSTWTTLCRVWANERPMRMDERYATEAKHSIRVSNFRVYFRDDISPEMQISYAGLTWRITGLAEVGYREELDITAEAVY
jgi:SPP1 family predicted phage head-tail adaptor